jgi:peptidoglycan/LPS O-acetylase OafA/YrhL
MIEPAILSDFVAVALQADVDPFEGIEQAIQIGIAVLSILLLALALSAYRRTRLKRLLYASAAFGLFAVQMLVEFLEDAVDFAEPYADIIAPTITFVILLLFFLGIVRKQSNGPG